MKMRLIAAALLCLAGSAQAATLSWNDTDVTANTDQTFDWAQGSFSVALAFTLASLDGVETTLLSVTDGSSNNFIASIVKSANSSDVVLKLNWTGAPAENAWVVGKTQAGLLKTGENLIAIVFDGRWIFRHTQQQFRCGGVPFGQRHCKRDIAGFIPLHGINSNLQQFPDQKMLVVFGNGEQCIASALVNSPKISSGLQENWKKFFPKTTKT